MKAIVCDMCKDILGYIEELDENIMEELLLKIEMGGIHKDFEEFHLCPSCRKKVLNFIYKQSLKNRK